MSWVLSAFTDEAGGQLEQQIKAAQDAGLSHIDLRGVNGHNITTLPIDEARAIAARLEEVGLRVNMFGSPIGKIDISEDFQIDRDKLSHLGKLAPIFKCKAVRLFSYYNKNNATADAWRKESLARLTELKAMARDMGLKLYHENERHIFGDRCPENEVIADALHDGDAFCLIFDFDNFNQSGDDVWSNWEKLRSRVDAFHLKDSDSSNQHVPIGEGAGQARRILKDAVERGWSGPAILEPHLKHSSAVMATGPSGQANQSFKEMTPAEAFQVAADAGKKLLNDVGADYV